MWWMEIVMNYIMNIIMRHCQCQIEIFFTPTYFFGPLALGFLANSEGSSDSRDLPFVLKSLWARSSRVLFNIQTWIHMSDSCWSAWWHALYMAKDCCQWCEPKCVLTALQSKSFFSHCRNMTCNTRLLWTWTTHNHVRIYVSTVLTNILDIYWRCELFLWAVLCIKMKTEWILNI